MKQINRRGFIKTGITGAGAIAVSPALTAGSFSEQADNIIYRTLGRTGLKIPVISFGVMRTDNPNLCKAAYEAGMRLFDTANGYLGGNSETMLGNFFKDFKRDSFMISTKVRLDRDRDGKPNAQTTSENFLETFNVSLSRLKMDYVDILYVHDVNTLEFMNYKPIISALQNLKKEGKVKYTGFSTHSNEPLVINAAAESDIYDVILTQYNYRIDYLTELQSAIKKAAASGIGIIAMKTLAGGGFLDKQKTKTMNTTAALKWVLSNPDITTTIPGMTSYDQVELNAKILADINLTDTERKDLIAAKADPGLFCSGCRQCLDECPYNLPIPDLMRAYMYAYGYSSPMMAKNFLSEIGITDNPCSNCDECKVNCSRLFAVREKITDVTRLLDVPSEFLT